MFNVNALEFIKMKQNANKHHVYILIIGGFVFKNDGED